MKNENVEIIKSLMNTAIHIAKTKFTLSKSEVERGRLFAHISFARFILDVLDEYEALEKDVAERHQNNDEFMIGWAIGKLEFSTGLMNTLNDIKK